MFNRRIGKKFSESYGQSGGSSLLPKIINVAADFPTTAEAMRDMGRTYVMLADVTDNDPTKTNTGQSFATGDEALWNGISAYVNLGPDAIWVVDTGLNEVRLITSRDINLQGGGLKDNNVTTSIKIGDALNTALNTLNKTFAGAINELQSLIDISTPIDLTAQLGAGGVTVFTIPFAVSAPTATSLYYNGTRETYGVDYTISGTTLTKIGGAAYGAVDGIRSLIFLPAIKLASISAFPAFKAQVSTNNTNITGDGTLATVIFQNDSTGDFYNLENNYDVTTGQYTAAFDQLFNAGAALLIEGVATTHDVTVLLTHKNSGGSEITNYPLIYLAPYSVRTSLLTLIFSGAADFKMSAGDTLECNIVGINSGKSISVINTSSQFYGHLVRSL